MRTNQVFCQSVILCITFHYKLSCCHGRWKDVIGVVSKDVVQDLRYNGEMVRIMNAFYYYGGKMAE